MDRSRSNPRNRLPAPKARIDTLTPVRPRTRAGIAPAPAGERTTAPPMAAASRNCLLDTSADNEIAPPCRLAPMVLGRLLAAGGYDTAAAGLCRRSTMAAKSRDFIAYRSGARVM